MATLTGHTYCPRCNGRMLRVSDVFSDYLNCLMCGFVHEPLLIDPAIARAEADMDYRASSRSRRESWQAAPTRVQRAS